MLSISKLRTICCELYTKIQKMKAIHNDPTVHHSRAHRCELYTKIQKMKAIHNPEGCCLYSPSAVNYTQRYKK